MVKGERERLNVRGRELSVLLYIFVVLRERDSGVTEEVVKCKR